MRLFKKLFIHSLKHYGVATAAAIAIMIFYLAPRDFAMFDFPDALKFTGLIITLVGLLILSIFYGALDTFGYAFSTFKKREKRQFEDMVEYSKVKARNRKIKELIYMPYITTGVLVLAFGLIVSLFIKPYPKLDAPANLEVKQVEDTLVLSWNKNDKASNGYIIYYSLYIESVNEEDQPEVFMIEVPQQDGEKIKIEIKELDLSKPYAFAIACNGVNGSYNGSDYTEIIFDSNK